MKCPSLCSTSHFLLLLFLLLLSPPVSHLHTEHCLILTDNPLSPDLSVGRFPFYKRSESRTFASSVTSFLVRINVPTTKKATRKMSSGDPSPLLLRAGRTPSKKAKFPKNIPNIPLITIPYQSMLSKIKWAFACTSWGYLEGVKNGRRISHSSKHSVNKTHGLWGFKNYRNRGKWFNQPWFQRG